MSLIINPALEHRLDHLAARTTRGKQELAEEGLERYLAYRESMEDAVAEGRTAAERGELVDHNEAMAMMDDVLANG